MKVIGKRTAKASAILDVTVLQKTLNQVLGHKTVPRGLYKFKTFEEADEWMIK